MLELTITSLLLAGPFATPDHPVHHHAHHTMPNSSRLARQITEGELESEDGRHRLIDASMFSVADAKPRVFKKHDLVQIIVQESSRAESTHELETEKEFDIDGRVDAWPHLVLEDLLQLQLTAGRTPSSELPRVRVGLSKEFAGEGEYTREDDFTTRLTAEVIAIRPNGNLVLEARTSIKMDDEEQRIKVTGECRSEDVSGANTIISNRLHDLSVEKTHTGELKKANEKGIVTKFLEALFAF